MAANTLPQNKPLEAAVESPAEAMQAQMLLLKQAHHGEGASMDASDKMEANRISGLPPSEQLVAFNEWAVKLARELSIQMQERIAANTRSQIELSAKLDASEKARELSDIERKKWEDLASVDGLLVEALNKRALLDEMQKQINNIDSGRNVNHRENQLKNVSVLFLDLDHFKMINDTPGLGHIIGDEALKEFFALIKENIRDDDIIGRYGGEELVVILPGADAQQASQKAERIRAAVEQNLKDRILRHCPDQEEKVRKLDGTVSIGVADYSIQSEKKIEPKELISKADQALYHSKNHGRNKVTVYEPETISAKDEKMAQAEEKPIES